MENSSIINDNQTTRHSHVDQSQRRRRRRKMMSKNQYFTSHYSSPTNNIQTSKTSLPRTYSFYDKSAFRNRRDYLTYFVVRLFLSVIIVWSFFTFFATNIVEGGDKVLPSDNNGVRSPIVTKQFIHNPKNKVSLRGTNAVMSHVESLNEKQKQQDQITPRVKGPKKQYFLSPSNSNKEKNIQPPKTAFVLVATKFLTDPIRSMSIAIESIIENTDLDRILCIVPVFSHTMLIEYGIQPIEVREYFENDVNAFSVANAANYKKSAVLKIHHESRNFRGTHRKVNAMKEKEQIDNRRVKVIIEDDTSDVESETTNNGNAKKFGVGKSRRDAAAFVKMIHEEEQARNNKKKSKKYNIQTNDEVILTLLRPDSILHKHDWLDTVTDALLGPTPTTDNPTNKSFHRRNAVSFALSQKTKQQQHMTDKKYKHHPHYHHHYNHHYLSNHLHSNSKDNKHTTTSLDINLTPVHTTTPLKSDLELTNGRSYPTPILEGSATSLLLSTFLELNSYVNLTMSDRYVSSTVGADIELSLNLWLCGSGIDIISDLHVEKDVMLMQKERDYVRYEEKVWLIREWMSDAKSDIQVEAKISETNATSLSLSDTLLLRTFNETEEMLNKYNYIQRTHTDRALGECRTFDWYLKEVNVLMKQQLELVDSHRKDEKKVLDKESKPVQKKPHGSIS